MKKFTFFIVSIFLININNFSQSLLINEFQAKNSFTFEDDSGEFDDWIEIANFSDQDINLNNYYITDDLSDNKKFLLYSMQDELIVPANGYLILWADGDIDQGKKHLNFKLSADNGVIALYSSSLQLIDLVNYTAQRNDISMGRLTVDKFTWKYFNSPTPGSGNLAPYFNGYTDDPVFSMKSGIYNTSTNLSIFSAHLDDSVYYTLDNSEPKENSILYTAPFQLTNTQVIRAVALKNNFIQSNIISHIYIQNANYTLPVLSIITDTANLFGPDGIYTNYLEPWEKSCQIKYIKENSLVTESNAGLRIQGASSTLMPKKSFRLFFKKEYGNGKFEYPIFNDPAINKFDKLVLKSGYDDDITVETGTLLRDALVLELWKKTGGFPQLSSWVILYLNHQYWGIYNLRESIDENFVKDHTDFKKIDLVRFNSAGSEVIFGSPEKWDNMLNLVKNNDLSVPENYNQISTMLDMDNFINLMAFVQCTKYNSWGWGISIFREATADDKWQVSIWDADRSLVSPEWNGFENAWDNTNGHQWAYIFPLKLMKNSEFREKLAQRTYELINTVFLPENSIAVLDSLYQIIKPEMEGEINRWNPGFKRWEGNVENLRDFLRRRPDTLLVQMKTYLNFSEISDKYEMASAQVFPNPFSDETNIKINIPKSTFVEISVFDINGRLIRMIYSNEITTGGLTTTWNGEASDGKKVPDGIYFMRISTQQSIQYIKVVYSTL